MFEHSDLYREPPQTELAHIAEAKFALESAFEFAPVGMAVHDDHLGFRVVNQAYCGLLGYAREQLLRLTLPEITHPEDIWVAADWNEFARGNGPGLLHHVKRLITREGETIHVNLSSKRVHGSGFAPFTVSTIQPLSERHEPTAKDLAREVWSKRIREALAEDHFVMYGQPILDLRTNEMVQQELLLRMVRRGKGERLIMPGEFMGPAEDLGLVVDIDQWVLREALELARNQRLTVNLSGLTISRPGLIRTIEETVLNSGVPPGNLVFEITETAVVNNLKAAEAFIGRLHRIGCSFALDDFGTGYGSFSYLKHLPVDYLKIDLEFVRDMVRNEADLRVVKAIAGAADLFGIATIGEGVEDAATLEMLRELDIDFAQGFHIGRPTEIRG